MVIRNINEIKNKALFDAISVNSFMSTEHPFLSLYIDPHKECAIKFEGKMPEKDIQRILYIASGERKKTPYDMEVEADYDYTYRNGTTEIYTKDGWKYTEDRI